MKLSENIYQDLFVCVVLHMREGLQCFYDVTRILLVHSRAAEKREGKKKY